MKKTYAGTLAANGEDIKVLLVDDEPIILKMLGEWMRNLGYAFATATNGLEAVEALKKEAYGLVITDINMPRMDGMQLLKHIKKNIPQTDVILITGLSAGYGSEDAIEAGAAYFLAKPFLVKDLKAALNRVKENRSLNRQLQKNGRHSVLREEREVVGEL